MTIGPLTDDTARIRDSFKLLRRLLGDINGAMGLEMRELSMGMSPDYLIAVEEGATIVRIGALIFGERG
jgi:PLP dependent protein